MMLREKSKVGHLILRKVGEKIASILSDEIFDNLGYVKEHTVWWLFEIKIWLIGY